MISHRFQTDSAYTSNSFIVTSTKFLLEILGHRETLDLNILQSETNIASPLYPEREGERKREDRTFF